MSTLADFIHSGILEMYVLGCLSPEEIAGVEAAMALHPEVRNEIDSISKAIEHAAMKNAIAPDVTIKPFLLATIDYMERLKKGEVPAFPAELNADSSIADYVLWIDREDMTVSKDLGDFYAKIIGFTPEITTAIVWIKHLAPHEVHTDEYEKFLILEGTCDIIVEEEVHSLKAGDYFAIPLHKTHVVKVTSKTPCKVILQRIAA